MWLAVAVLTTVNEPLKNSWNRNCDFLNITVSHLHDCNQQLGIDVITRIFFYKQLDVLLFEIAFQQKYLSLLCMR